MNDDSLLRQLAGAARERTAEERERLDERWDRLAAGELSPEEEAELRAQAATSSAGREALAAFTPLGAEFEARMARLAGVGRAAAPAAPTEPVEPAGKTLPFRRRRAGLGLGVGLAAAAAIAAGLALGLARPAPFPLYQGSPLGGGSQTVRDPEAPRSFSPGETLVWTLQPPTPVGETVEARAFLAGPKGELRPWAATVQASAQGAVQIAGNLPRKLAPGPWTLWVVVGRNGKLPDAGELSRHTGEATPRARNWMALQKTLQIQ